MTRLNTPSGSPASAMISASAQAEPGTRSAGLRTTQLPKASAGAIFQAGMAIGKFQGVISPTTPKGSRVTSTLTPGRTEATASPGEAQGLAREEAEDLPRPAGLGDALGQRLALLARQEAAQLVLARQDFGADPVERVGADLRARHGPGGEARCRRRDRLLGLRLVGIGVLADDVGGVRRVDVARHGGPADPLAADQVAMQLGHALLPKRCHEGADHSAGRRHGKPRPWRKADRRQMVEPARRISGAQWISGSGEGSVPIR